MQVGFGTYFGEASPQIRDAGEVIIGKYCDFAAFVVFDAGNQHDASFISTFNFGRAGMNMMGKTFVPPKLPTIIGNSVWVGEGAYIKHGVTVGDGAVIGAYAVVTRDVPSYCVFAGNPGRVMKWRFDEPERIFLETLKWWDWPVEIVQEAVPILMSNDVEALFDFAKARGLA